ncbi:InlB B-repeat-containing protein [Marivirga salinae]|uniref:InlB B-repeat-containing protein n=1 Tax=Marivirga salinarum TaxID=3059078 RepID=A0AA51N8Y6_9BACT|nr:InlB B-repeat-containing protein [Marivirga sp. BDSF4-3]WMN10674.1 InlB B-repeat-containing protein [Marivirga sp. BDSF4-3]
MKKYLLISLLAISLQSFSQTILYVDKDATGLNDGTSWSNAFTDLQSALALDASGDQIWIADGTYIPGSSRASSYQFDASNVTIYGGFNGTESSLSERDLQANKTILSGDLLDNDLGLFATASNTKWDNAYHVVTINANDVSIDGVVITKGVATGGTSSQKVGAGIYVFDNSAGFVIRNCEFTLNTSYSGSGIRANINANTTVKIENSKFNNNIANNGVGIFILSKVGRTINVEITNCLFENNYINDQIAAGGSGTAIYISPNENNSTINTNISNCTFANNFENTSSSIAEKAVVNVGKRFADPNYVHNITVSNSIFYNNVDASGSIVGSIGRGNLQAPNSITVYNSIDQDVFTYVNPANLFNTLNSNPLFADMANNVFTLQTGSPAIDAGDNSKIPAGVTTDLEGNQRILNSTVDIGAYEFDPSAVVQRTLTLNATNGSITPDVAPTNGTYDNGTVVELTAVPDAGYQFNGWSGDASGTSNPISVTMDADKTVTANFILIQRTLSLNATNGSITPDVAPTNGTYDDGTVVELTAVPDAGFVFDGWSGDASGTTNPISVTLDADKTVTATFSPIQRTLSLNATNGSITPDVAPTNGTYDNGTVVELTAVPDAGYQFNGWSGDASGTSNPISVTMDADKTVTANFILIQRTLSLNATNGSITPDVAPTNGTYDDGTVVELTAVPDAGFVFDGWSGDASGTTNPISVTLDADKTVTATFSPIQRTLSLNATNGSITPDVAPTNGTYDNGTVVELTAVPDAGFVFDGWSGDASGTTNPISVTMDADKTVTANFSPLQRTLSLNATNGSITPDVAPTNGTYDNGTVVELTAVPDAGYQFDGWSGDATGTTNPISVTMDADKTVTATFSPIQRTLSLNATNGSITPDVAPTNGTYDNGTVVELTAVPNAGYQFDGWSGDATGTTNPISVTMDADKTVTANFSPLQRTLSLNATNGSITPDVAPTNGTYDNGTVVELTAVPDAGYQFDGWSGDASGTTNPISVTLDADKTVTANFSPLQRTLSLNATNGSITPDVAPTNGTYDNGTVVELTAVPDAGYQFDGWSGDVTGTTNPISVTMDADKTVTANFILIQRTLSLNATNGSISPDVAPTNGTYDNGTVVELTAVPDAGYQFDSWSGDVTGTTNPISVTMDANKTVTATFSPIQRTLSLNATNGSITPDVAPTNGTYDNGTVIELTAVPDAGYQFDGWSGDVTGTTNPISLTLDADKTVTANFSPLQRTLSLNATNGSITPDVAPTNGTYDNGTVIELTAVPDAGYQFDGWSGDASGTTNPISVTMDADKTVTALITLIDNSLSQTITFDAIPEKTFGDEPFELTATASSGLAVSFNSSNESVATINGTTVTIIGAGITIITASQAGNDEYSAAAAVSQELVVNKADQSITIDEISDKDVEAADFEVIATTTSGLELFYSVLSGPATVSGNLINLTGEPGTVEIEVSQAGNNNYNAASATTTFEVVEDPCIGFEATATVIQNVSCNGDASGSFEVNTSSGTAPFTYTIGNENQDNGLFENMMAGSYEIIVTDANGCSATATVEISEAEALEITAETTDSNSIFGNGSISLTVNGGTGNYSYEWSNSATTASLTDLGIGEYTVTVTDEAGCSITESYSIGGVTANTEAFEFNIYPNPVINQITISHGEKVNEISLMDAKGKIILEQKASGKETLLEMTGLPAGMYFIRLDDGKMKRIIKE